MKPSSPQAPLPRLRADLAVGAKPTGVGAEVIHLFPAGERHGTELLGFELSLARMLDGHRSAEDVISHAAELGIPIDRPALEAFVKKLSAEHLLAEKPDDAPAYVSPWPERSEWDPTIRLQFQLALKAIRTGKLREAAVRVEHLVATAPAMPESLKLREWLEQHPTGTTGGETFRETVEKVERDWLGLDRRDLEAARPSQGPKLVLLALLAVAALSVFLPLPMKLSLPARLVPATVSRVVATHDGTIDQVLVREGQWVPEGAMLLTYGPPSFGAAQAATAGVVTGLVARGSAPVFEGQQMMSIEDTRHLRMLARPDAEQAQRVRPGQTATIALGERHVQSVVSSNAQGVVTAELDNTDEVIEPGPVVVDIDVAWRPLIGR